MFERAIAPHLGHNPFPYWDWTTDRAIPAWLDELLPLVRRPDGAAPIQVVRKGGLPNDLPTRETIDAVLANTVFTSFTSMTPAVNDGGGLEGVHNGVHDWF